MLAPPKKTTSFTTSELTSPSRSLATVKAVESSGSKLFTLQPELTAGWRAAVEVIDARRVEQIANLETDGNVRADGDAEADA
jgi:hypothetical protein